jgi:hypothetical protein
MIEYFFKRNLHDILKVLAFIASVALLIGELTIHSWVGLSID